MTSAVSYVTIVTVLALVAYLWMGVRVGLARRTCGIAAPAMTGDPILERHIRVQANTLEWLPVFLAALWMSAMYWPQLAVAGLGLMWVLGRIVYAFGYVAEPNKRAFGFLLQAVATFALIIAAFLGALRSLVVAGV